MSLSVIVATTEPRPDLVNCLAVLEPQVAALGGELIVGDGSHGSPLDHERMAATDRIRWIRLPGASVLDLRARALEMARVDIIAATEDHVLVSADWCAQIMSAFAQHPKALAVTGPVMNGSNRKLLDWANFLLAFGSFVPPVNGDQRVHCPPPANVAYRRSVIPAGSIRTGWMELELNPRLHAEGKFQVCDEVTVTHVQSHGFWATTRSHFDNGRTTTGLHKIRLTGRQLPWNLFRGTVRVMGGDERIRPTIRKSLPFLFMLCCCHCLGEVVGIVAGPGGSPPRLH